MIRALVVIMMITTLAATVSSSAEERLSPPECEEWAWFHSDRLAGTLSLSVGDSCGGVETPHMTITVQMPLERATDELFHPYFSPFSQAMRELVDLAREEQALSRNGGG